jgi:squalene cyclase
MNNKNTFMTKKKYKNYKRLNWALIYLLKYSAENHNLIINPGTRCKNKTNNRKRSAVHENIAFIQVNVPHTLYDFANIRPFIVSYMGF